MKYVKSEEIELPSNEGNKIGEKTNRAKLHH
jgi:hypothetical protein